jgi:hypothetical protein
LDYDGKHRSVDGNIRKHLWNPYDMRLTDSRKTKYSYREHERPKDYGRQALFRNHLSLSYSKLFGQNCERMYYDVQHAEANSDKNPAKGQRDD